MLGKNLVEQQGSSWETLFDIDAAALTNASRDNFFVHILGNDKISAICLCFYTGASALTLSEYNNLPVGSVISDTVAKKWHRHNTATTWVSSGADS